jgi:hypothetical protein
MTATDAVTVSCGTVRAGLAGFLEGTMSRAGTALLRAHLDACAPCWEAWNAFRWERASGTGLYRDLRAFLGAGFTYGLDSSRALAREWDTAAPSIPEETARFFRGSVSYLYNLAIWEASGNRPRYVDEAVPLLHGLGARTVIDYGCGTGSDTLALRDRGFTVIPCEFRSPSARFFQWRARRAGQDPSVCEPGQLPPGTAADVLWIIDTLDHLPDPEASIGILLARVSAVICEQLAAGREHGNQRFHYRRPAGETAAMLAAHGFGPAASTPVLQCWHKSQAAPTAVETGR